MAYLENYLKEECVHIKFCTKMVKNYIQTFRILKAAFGEQKMGVTQVFEWFSKFKMSVSSAENANIGKTIDK
jgi:hypothetical protein